MTNEQFLQQFGHFIDAPNGIQKLREMILQLAVRGKLVEQESSDEPASILLDKITKEKDKLIEEKRIKKSKPLPDIDDIDLPYCLPNSWEWLHVTDAFYPISVSKNKVKTSQIQESGSIPVVDQGQSFVAGYIDNESLKIKIPGPVIVFGDHTTALKYIDFSFVAGADGVKILRPLNGDERYFFLVAKTLPIDNRGYGRHYSRLIDNLFPLPPLAEQHRIVAKVDELMAHCDQLEAERNAREATHQRLIRAVHHPLTEAGDANPTSGIDSLAAWHRIRDNFADLYTTLESVQALRRTILKLAVQGKLVAQDSSEEPALAQLEQIKVAKEQQIAEEKFKKPKALPPITDKDALFILPGGWSYTRLGEVVRVINGRAYKRHEMLEKGTPLLRVGNLFTSKEWYYSDLHLEDEKYCDEGDLIYAWSASFGPFIWSGPKVIYHYHIWKLDFYNNNLLFKNYLYTFLQEKTQEIKAAGHGISMAHMTKDKMEKLVVPVPPLAEQHRIVAKVDELMALCDQLEANIRDKNDTATRYAEAIVQQIAAA